MHLVHSAPPPVTQRDRLLRLPDVERVTGLRRSALYRLCQLGQFPPRVKLTERCVAWKEADVLQWVQDRIAASATPTTRPASPAVAEGRK